MSNIQQQAKGKNEGEIRYLTPLNIDNSIVKKYCRFKKYGIKVKNFSKVGSYQMANFFYHIEKNKISLKTMICPTVVFCY